MKHFQRFFQDKISNWYSAGCFKAQIGIHDALEKLNSTDGEKFARDAAIALSALSVLSFVFKILVFKNLFF